MTVLGLSAAIFIGFGAIRLLDVAIVEWQAARVRRANEVDPPFYLDEKPKRKPAARKAPAKKPAVKKGVKNVRRSTKR